MSAGRALGAELARYPRWFVLTGAGCSTESGIPAYRDAAGNYMHGRPLQLREFLDSEHARQRYWARSAFGFERVHAALPNRAHLALAALERLGRCSLLVTQNVDGLHQKAGSQNVLELHGQLSQVTCLGCRRQSARADVQARLIRDNPMLRVSGGVRAAPDGDAEPALAAGDLRVPACEACGGVLKPSVVFFGETVPGERVINAYRALEESNAVLVVGSSLMIFSGYRFVRRAVALDKPVVIVNAGKTRADDWAKLKLEGSCGELLSEGVTALERGP